MTCFNGTVKFLNLLVSLTFSLIFFTGCAPGKFNFTGNISTISGKITPFDGSIAFQSSLVFSSANAALCADPVYAKLYLLKSDGSIDDGDEVASQLVGSDAKYSFDLEKLELNHKSENVTYLVQAEGCNGNIYKRPVTKIDGAQDINEKTTIVSQVVNANTMLPVKLNQVKMKEVELLLNSVSGSSMNTALTSITSDSAPVSKFTEIFGTNPSVIQIARPEVTVKPPVGNLNELAATTFTSSTFHVDPGYSFAYRWKLDGVVKSSVRNWTFIPSADQQGIHQIDYFVGKDDGLGNIDLSKPYYTTSFTVTVNNNMLPVAPAVSIDPGTPSPRTTNTIDLQLATGISLANCDSFAKLAVTETNVAPGPLQFHIDCADPVSQTETITFTPGDGNKALYLWAMDSEGNISSSRSVSFKLDSTLPLASLTFTDSALKGGSSKAIALAGSDATSGLSNLSLYYAADGSTYSLLSSLALNATSYNWSVPSANVTGAKLKLVATDNAGFQKIVESGAFGIDSTAPSAPGVVLASAAISSSGAVTMTLGSCSDVSEVLVTNSLTQPSSSATGWQACSIAAGAITHTVTGDGVKTLYVWARDFVGNMASSANSVSMTLDTTPPVISAGPATAGPTHGGAVQNISWTATDATPATVSLSYFDGTLWNIIGTGLSNSGTRAWTVPSLNITTAAIRLTVTDSAGNMRVADSSTFTIDSILPVISSFQLAGGATSVALPNIPYALTASDNMTTVTHIRFSESGTFADNGWIAYATSGTRSLSAISGNKRVYTWVKDGAGNVSVASYYDISLDYGSPPEISIISPVSSSGPYSVGDPVHVEWSCSSTNGLDPNPVRIRYTNDDGLTFSNVTSWIPNNLSATTGDYDWTFPAGVTTFRLLVECKSQAGVVTSAYTSFQNTSGWSLFAGDPGSMSENINANLALMIKDGSYWQSMAADSSGNIFYARGSTLMKIDSQTGLVTRFAGDPDNGSCTIAAGQDPLATSFNRIGAPTIYGTNASGDSLIFLACSKIWLMNTMTRNLSVLVSSPPAIGTPYLSKNRKLFYYSTNRLWSLDLNSANQTPVLIHGTGVCSGSAPATGIDAKTAAIQGAITSNNCAENYLMVNHDESKIWVGCRDGYTGCGPARRLEWNSVESRYDVASVSMAFSFQDGNTGHCSPSYDYPRVWCNGRHNTNVRTTFNLVSETFEPRPSIPNQFIRYTAAPGGMVSLSSTNILTSHTENADGTITTVQIGGSNIETYGNGTSLTKVAFSAVNDLSYSPVTKNLFVRTTAGVRNINLSSLPSTTIQTLSWPSPGSSDLRITQMEAGDRVVFPQNFCGVFGNGTYSFAGTTLTALSAYANVLGCYSGTRVPYPIPDNTPVAGNNLALENKLRVNDRALIHSNGKQYFFAKNGSNEAILYSSDRTTIKWIAGRTGAAGYDALDSGNIASGALLNSVIQIKEISSGPNSGDILILDNLRLRLITIFTEAGAPKIYDILNIGGMSGFPAGGVIGDFVYDPSTELSNGSNNVIGSGKMYFVTTANTVYRVTPLTVSGNSVTSASLSAYAITGTTITGTARIALTAAGLLVTQPNKQRILRVSP